MTSQRALIVIGLLFVATIFIVQSAPVEPLKEGKITYFKCYQNECFIFFAV